MSTTSFFNTPLGRVRAKQIDDEGGVDEGGGIELFEAREDAKNSNLRKRRDLVAPAIKAAV